MFEKFKDKFIEDALELLEKLEDDLLVLEESPTDKNAIDQTFRTMHTIKGAAGIYGFDRIVELTHELESFYHAVRDGEKQIAQKTLTLTFSVVDFIKYLLENEVIDEENTKLYSDLIAKIKQLNSSEVDIPVKEQDTPSENSINESELLLQEDTQDGTKLHYYYVRYQPDGTVFYRGVNPLSVFRELSEIGAYKNIIHNEITPIETQISEKNLVSYWEIIICTDLQGWEIENIFLFFSPNEFSYIELDLYNNQFNDEFISQLDKIRNSVNNVQLPDNESRIVEFENYFEILFGEFAKLKLNSEKFTGKCYYLLFTPHIDSLKRGVNPMAIFKELENLGTQKSTIHNELIPLEKQIENREITSFWEIFTINQQEILEFEDVFMFFPEDEYKIVEIKPSLLNEDENIHEILNPIYQKIYQNNEIGKEEYINTIQKNFFELAVCYKEKEKQESTLVELDELSENASPKEESVEKKSEKSVAKSELTSLKVDFSKLEEMLNIVSSIVILKSQFDTLEKEIENPRLTRAVKNLDKLSKQLRDNALNLRLVPIGTIMTRFKRLVRDLAIQLNKEVELITEGTDIELDKTIIAAIEDPLMHIIRNSIDHGIETPEVRLERNKSVKGIVRFISFYSGSSVVIQIQDDGAGIDINRIRQKAIERGLIEPNIEYSNKDLFMLIFVAGFSTAQSITQISGRGVGMDVVKKNISELRGEISIDSELGLGTSVTIRLPLVLSIIDCLLVKVERVSFLIPVNYVDCCENLSKMRFTQTFGQLKLKDEYIPSIYLHQEFELREKTIDDSKVVIVKQNEKNYGIVVEDILGEYQVVAKPLSVLHRKQEFLSGASTLGDGSMALVLDINKLIKLMNEQHSMLN